MGNRARREALELDMADTRRRMVRYQHAGNWKAYHNALHCWLAQAKLHGLLYARELAEEQEQLSLLPLDVGRVHDRPPAA